MSADNRICIMNWDKGTAWYGWHGSCSINYYEPPGNAEWFRTEEDALNWARKEADNITILECGITTIGITEQQNGLLETARDLIERLDNIKKYNDQYPSDPDLNNW